MNASGHFDGLSDEKVEIDLLASGDVLHLCPACKVFAILLYSLLSIVAFFGNALILAVYLQFRQLRTPTNMLIANLAVGDLMISIFCIPLSYWHVIIFEDQRWIFGAFLCKIFNYLQATAVFVSSWTLVAISFDRFMAICVFSMSPWLRLNMRRSLIVILATWFFSLLMALPLLIVNQLEQSRSGVDTCLEKWLDFFSERFVQTYTWMLFALQYCMPLAVLVVTYTLIGLKMWNSKVPGHSTANKRPSKELAKNSHSPMLNNNPCGSGNHAHDRKESVKKLIPMVLMVSALYAICWLPQNLLMNIWLTFDQTILSHPYILYIWWGAHSLAMFHSVVNPFIYYSQNKRIHSAVRHLLWLVPFVRASMGTSPNSVFGSVWLTTEDKRYASVIRRIPTSERRHQRKPLVHHHPTTMSSLSGDGFRTDSAGL